MIKRIIATALTAALLIAGGYYYWSATRTERPTAPVRPSLPPPEVSVVNLVPATIPLPLTYAGRIAGFRNVEIRPQVGGVVLKREYEEGARVSRGQVLFRIDPRPYQVALDRAQAQVAQAEATFVQAQQNFKRIEQLASRQIATEKQLDDARGARDQADAAVKLAQAEVANATLNLGYTTVSAPVAGITSLRSPPEGTLVLAQQTLLTTITQIDPAYVNFAVTDEEFKSLRETNRARPDPIKPENIVVELQYGDRTTYDHPGKLDVTASSIDSQTGTIQIRAIFPNPDGSILPGQFVRVVLRGITLPDAILVPKQAISQGPQGPFVYVVAANKTAEARPVKLGRELDAGWIVQAGLKGGEQLIVDGVMRIRPGAPVRPVPGVDKGRNGPPGPIRN